MNQVILTASVRDNEKHITVNPSILNRSDLNKWKNEYLSGIKEVLANNKTENGRPLMIVAESEVIYLIAEWIHCLYSKLEGGEDVGLALDALIYLYRCLRSSSIHENIQLFIVQETEILKFTVKLFKHVFAVDRHHLLLKIIVQFVNNLISPNEKVVNEVHKHFSEIVKICLKENICVFEASAVIHKISLCTPIYDLDLLNSVLGILRTEDLNEFLHYFLETSMKTKQFWDSYQSLNADNRTVILEYLKHLLLKNKDLEVHEACLVTLISMILTSCDVIFQSGGRSKGEDNIQEISLALEVLATLSSKEHSLRTLQLNKDLFIHASVLLINVHKLGKEQNNCFTPVQKLSELSISNEKLKYHPAFGFKADLIRLIGNMCWKNPEMQNLAREAEVLPVILDSCNIDAKNPFIIQWGVLAIKNILENNLENQKFVAQLQKKGMVTNEALNQLGLTLHGDGETEIKVVPLDALRKECDK